jgi:glycosyltransferase involved in cell wall biosynthesis
MVRRVAERVQAPALQPLARPAVRAAQPRLLCVYQHAPTPGAGGFYRHRRYFAELVGKGWHVDLVSTPVDYLTGTVPEPYRGRAYVHERIDGIDHHWVWAGSDIHRSRGRRVLNYVSFAAASTARAATLKRPDVIWASSPPLPVGTVGAVLSRRFRRPWLLEIRDLWPESAAAVEWVDPQSRIYRLLEQSAQRQARSAAAVIVPSVGQVEGAQRYGATTVHVLPGVVEDAPPDPEARRAGRAELGVDDRVCLAVYVGALGVANGLDVLLDAAKLLPRDVRIAIALAGDGSAGPHLRQRVEREGIDSVRFLGVVERARVSRILAASDVCLHLLRPDPSLHGCLPNKVLDYLGAHRPVITTADGVPRQIAVSAGGCYAATAAELAAELERWAAMSAEERARRGERSFRYGRRRFGPATVIEELERVLAAAMGRPVVQLS